LTTDEMAALSQQGFVSRELRRNGRYYYKLRFRRNGKQRVCYLGRSPPFVEGVQRELQALQSARKADQELARLTHSARRALRLAKQRLAPLLVQAGFRFHGFAVRRRRTKDKRGEDRGVFRTSERNQHGTQIDDARSIGTESIGDTDFRVSTRRERLVAFPGVDGDARRALAADS